MSDTARYFSRRARWSRWETLFWLSWLAAFFVPAANLPLLTQILVWGLFAVSLDMVLGYRGIPSLGHAAFFGIGAYTAGFLGKHGWSEPLSGLLIAAACAGLAGLAAGRVLRGLHGVAVLMVTLGLNMILFDVVQRATEGSQARDHLGDRGRLARSRGAGDPDDARMALVGRAPPQQHGRLRSIILDQRDQACDVTRTSGTGALEQGVEVGAHPPHPDVTTATPARDMHDSRSALVMTT